MPIPFLLVGAAAVAGVNGIKKGVKATENNAQAKNILKDAERIYDNAKFDLEVQKRTTTDALDNYGRVKLDAWGNQMKRFVEAFESFKNVRLEDDVELNERLKLKISQPSNLKNMEVAALKATEVLNAGVSSLGAGALAGIASYGGAMMFASASTGTAIASLSGAAATNATLAWFGGGSLAAGGLGMAGGAAVLGGIVAGPILAVAGSIMAAKSEENLSQARATLSKARNAASQMRTMEDVLRHIKNLADEYQAFTIQYLNFFTPVLEEVENIKNKYAPTQKGFFFSKRVNQVKVDFNTLTIKEQKTLHLSWLMAQILNSVLAAPLLNDKGEVDKDAKLTLIDANDSIPELMETRTEIQYLSDDSTSPISNYAKQEESETYDDFDAENELEETLDDEENPEEFSSKSSWNQFNNPIKTNEDLTDLSSEMVGTVKETSKKIYHRSMKWIKNPNRFEKLSTLAQGLASEMLPDELSGNFLNDDVQDAEYFEASEEVSRQTPPSLNQTPPELKTTPPTLPPQALSLEKQIELLKQLKELLDLGVLSQEEFDMKKKEILSSQNQ